MSQADDFDEWALDASAFWLGSFGGFDAVHKRVHLATPTEEDFPVDPELDDEDLARDYLAFAQVHARLEDRRFEVVPVESFNAGEVLRGVPHHLTPTPVSTDDLAPIAEGDAYPILYEPDDVRDPTSLVATIASGMSHYHLYEARLDPPGSPAERPYLVDHGAVFLGFGIFVANSAFRFDQTERGTLVGWGYRRRGSLTEHDVSSVLALFALLFDITQRDVERHLEPNPKAYFRSACTRLTKRQSSRIDKLRAVHRGSDGPFR